MIKSRQMSPSARLLWSQTAGENTSVTDLRSDLQPPHAVKFVLTLLAQQLTVVNNVFIIVYLFPWESHINSNIPL